MSRLPVPGSDTNVWGTVLNDYLLREHKSDGTHDVQAFLQTPAAQTVLNAKQDRAGAVFSLSVPILMPSVGQIIVWRAPFAVQLSALRAYRVGGTGVALNARKNGTDMHLAADISVAVVGAWIEGEVLQNTAYSVGDTLEIMLTAVNGTPAQLAVQLDWITL